MEERTERTAEGKQEIQVIHNRDIPLLCDILPIMQAVRMLEERREWERDRMFSITRHLSGMPRSGSLPTGFETAMEKISELEENHGKRVRVYTRKMRQAERVLNSIPSVSMRVFVSMMYIENAGKQRIMEEMGMTEWGFRRARESVEQADCMANVKWRERFILDGRDE